MATDHGWVAYGSGYNSHLSPDVRAEMGHLIQQRLQERGALLAVVEVRVYENGEEPQMGFPPDALFGVETDSSALSEVVARAREQLAHWR
jgi:hypothetical protein